jgi:hypothetical protein
MYFAAALVDSLRTRYNTRWTLARIVAGADIHFVVGRDGSTLNFKQVHVSLQPGRAWLVHEKFVAHYFPLSSGMHVEAIMNKHNAALQILSPRRGSHCQFEAFRDMPLSSGVVCRRDVADASVVRVKSPGTRFQGLETGSL